jgi:hypothetical protein
MAEMDCGQKVSFGMAGMACGQKVNFSMTVMCPVNSEFSYGWNVSTSKN